MKCWTGWLTSWFRLLGEITTTSDVHDMPSEGRQNENHNHRKLIKLITWTTALSNSMKLWATPCRATQDWWVMVKSSDKTWSTGESERKKVKKLSHARLFVTPWAVACTKLLCPWDFLGKSTEVVCHSFLQWTMFCQNSPPWPVHLGWPYTAWLFVSLC